jgi:hypothetical protein
VIYMTINCRDGHGSPYHGFEIRHGYPSCMEPNWPNVGIIYRTNLYLKLTIYDRFLEKVKI